MDYEPEALRFASRNAVHNGVPQPCWVAMDWRKPTVKPRSLRFIWGGDIMYEQRFAAPCWISSTMHWTGTAWRGWRNRAARFMMRSVRSSFPAAGPGAACMRSP
mgnify:CR=1 FL=1